MLTPLSRQLLVAISPQLAAFSVGGALIYPSLILDYYKGNDSSIQLDLDSRSWIGSMYGLSGIPVILMPIVTQSIGRKLGYMMSCTYVMVGWILAYYATTFALILTSQFFHGLAINSLLPVSYQSMSEMIAPKYRFISMQAFGIFQCLGVATCGIMGRFFHFKVVIILMFVPTVIALVAALVWTESPSWFACRGEFEKCAQTFIRLRGSDELSMRELRDLIVAQKENLCRKDGNKMGIGTFWRKVSSRDFYMPVLHTFVLINMLYWSGADVILIYFMDMAAKSTTNADATFYAAIVMYVIVVVGLILADIAAIKFKNKTVLLSSTCGVIVFLLTACLTTGLQSLGVLSNDSLVSLYVLLLCIACASIGLDSLVFVISVELMPVKHRSIGGAMFVVINCMLYASSQKFSPYLFHYVDLWGSFLIYSLNAILCTLFVWKYVPETKGRSLQEIEDFYIHGQFIERKSDEEAMPMNSYI